MTAASTIWLLVLLTGVSACLSVRYLYSRRWVPAAIALVALILNVGSLAMQVDMSLIDTETARRIEAECAGAPKLVPYRPGMSLCPGQTAVIEVPADIVAPSGTDI